MWTQQGIQFSDFGEASDDLEIALRVSIAEMWLYRE